MNDIQGHYTTKKGRETTNGRWLSRSAQNISMENIHMVLLGSALLWLYHQFPVVSYNSLNYM